MSRNPSTVTLHQQEGALTMQAFAEREGLTLQQAVTAARRGQLLGARQNPLSNRWWVYPPAKLLHRPKSRSKPAAAAVGCPASSLPPRPDWLKPVPMPQPKKQARRPKQFDSYRSVMDVESFVAPKPEGAKLVIAPGIEGGHFVLVSFVAKDWNVTPRRIRALLCEGRLLGRLQVNGYWEVRFPYSFTFGTRGPGLKRQQKQERRAA